MIGARALLLPWPPSLNVAWYRGQKGRLTQAGRIFRDEVIRLAAGPVPFTEPVRVDAYFFPPDRRKRDNSNHTKVMYDALTKAGLWADDSLIAQESYYTGEVVRGGAVLLFVEPFRHIAWAFGDVATALGVDVRDSAV